MRSALVLTACGLLAALLVSVIAERTAGRIAANEQQQALAEVSTVLPPGTYDTPPHQDSIGYSDPDLTAGNELPVYRAHRDGVLVAAAMTVIAPDGYVAPITLLVGIDAAGNLVNVRALRHRETPGLGDRIETRHSDWIRQLTGPSPETGWLLKKDGGEIDALTGATVTSRATLAAVNRALVYFADHKDELTRPKE